LEKYKMKKFTVVFIFICLVLFIATLNFTGCADPYQTGNPGNQPNGSVDPDVPGNPGKPESGKSKNVEGDLSELVQKIYENLKNIDDSIQLPFTMEMELTEEGTQFNPNVEYFIGVKNIPFKEAVVSEAAIGSQAYSLVLLRMEAGADIDSAGKLIKENVDPRKWICVGVDPSDVVVDSIGDLLILIMSDHSAKLQEAFLQLS